MAVGLAAHATGLREGSFSVSQGQTAVGSAGPISIGDYSPLVNWTLVQVQEFCQR